MGYMTQATLGGGGAFLVWLATYEKQPWTIDAVLTLIAIPVVCMVYLTLTDWPEYRDRLEAQRKAEQREDELHQARVQRVREGKE